MLKWFFIITVVVISVAGQRSYDFSLNQNDLFRCIRNYFMNCDNSYYRDIGIVNDIAQLVSQRFQGKSFTIKKLEERVRQLCKDIRCRKSHLFKDLQVHESLRSDLEVALINCDILRTDYIVDLPTFTTEQPEISSVLNYILVDWPMSLFDMIQTRYGRSVLRRYAEEAGASLAMALNSVESHERFRYLLRSSWRNRAQTFFDGRRHRIPYTRHRFTLQDPYPHTYDKQALLLYRRYDSFILRNRIITCEEFNAIMYIHNSNRPGNGEIDVFSLYELRRTMTQAEYYLETHIDQFYRILFFFLEMQVHDISTDEEDVYNGPLPNTAIPIGLQDMVDDYRVYRNYLSDLRIVLELALTSNSQFQINIGYGLSSRWIQEEDLISLFSLWIQQQNRIRDKTNLKTNITSIKTTTPRYDSLERKDSFDNRNGKRYCQGLKTVSSEDTQQNVQRNGFFGYNTYNSELLDDFDLSTEELSMATIVQNEHNFMNLRFPSTKCVKVLIS